MGRRRAIFFVYDFFIPFFSVVFLVLSFTPSFLLLFTLPYDLISPSLFLPFHSIITISFPFLSPFLIPLLFSSSSHPSFPLTHSLPLTPSTQTTQHCTVTLLIFSQSFLISLLIVLGSSHFPSLLLYLISLLFVSFLTSTPFISCSTHYLLHLLHFPHDPFTS